MTRRRLWPGWQVVLRRETLLESPAKPSRLTNRRRRLGAAGKHGARQLAVDRPGPEVGQAWDCPAQLWEPDGPGTWSEIGQNTVNDMVIQLHA